jgi:hypothetical protein
MSSYSQYANALARLEEQKGAALAQGATQQGQIWGGALSNIGQFISQIPQQRAQLARVQQQAEANQLAVEREKRIGAKEQREEQKDAALTQIFQEEGGLTDNALSRIYGLDPALAMDISKKRFESDKLAFDFSNAQWEHKKKELEFVANVLGSATDAESYNQGLYTLRSAGKDIEGLPPYSPDAIAQFNRQTMTGLQRLEADRPKPPKLFNVSTVNDKGEPVTKVVPEIEGAEYPKPATETGGGVASFEAFVRSKYGANPTPDQIIAARLSYFPQQPPIPVVIQTETGPGLLDRGKGVVKPIKTESGEDVKPAPTAQERNTAQSYAKAKPILSAISELSEKINIGQGVAAKAQGAVEQQKAKVNLNDDVAEYEALISGFTPLIARALGHTGVLTQQDVDSVTKMFPRPGDSKSLRDRKVARIEQLISAIEGNSLPSNSAAPPAAAPKNPFR